MALATAAAGYEVLGPTQLDGLIETVSRLGRGDVVHVQWTSPLVQRASSVVDAQQRLKRFQRSLDRFVRRGGRVVWTIHNALPHELSYEDEERDLMAYLARVSSAIHVMNPETASVMASDVALPLDKLVVIPHPSYAGVYPDQWTRESARESFGLLEKDKAIVFVGQIRPYKGIDTLLEALQGLEPEAAEDTLLLLAGMVSDEEAGALERLLPSSIPVVFQPGFVEDSDLSRWYRAADLAVLPYQRILNSGSAHLAATFGVPVVLPGAPHLHAEFGTQSWVHFFDPDRSTASLKELLSSPATYERDLDEFDSFNSHRSPWRLSQLMWSHVISPRSH